MPMPEAPVRMSKNGLVVDGEGWLRRLAEWDFFYCAPGTEHIIVATGSQSAIVLAVGARGRGVGGGVVYKVCEAAGRYGASVVRETASSAVAYKEVYASLPRSRFVKYRPGWLPAVAAPPPDVCDDG